MRNLFLLIVILSLSNSALAEKNSSQDRRAALMRLEVHFGDKVNVYKIQSADVPELVANGKPRTISQENLKAVIDLANKAAKEKSNEERLCGRQYIRLTLAEKKKPTQVVGCIGSKTPVTTKLTELSNAMLLL